MIEDPVLPKQWKQWLRVGGFDRLEKKYGQSLSPVYNWTGFGRHWRINCNGQMQASVRFVDFDRWARSVYYTTEGVPATEKEFIERVALMLSRIARKERLIGYLSRHQ